eukprot:g25213.t1
MPPIPVDTKEVIFDISRLLRSRDRPFATGVDRIDLAVGQNLVNQFGPRCHFLYAGPAGPSILHQQSGRALLESLEEQWNGSSGDGSFASRRKAQRYYLPQIILRALTRAQQRAIIGPDTTYVVASHSGLGKVEGGLRRFDPDGVLKRLVYIHDIIPIEMPEYQRPGTSTRFRSYLTETINGRVTVASNSHDTDSRVRMLAAKEGWQVERYLVLKPELARTDSLSSPADRRVASYLSAPGPFFSIIGTVEPRKNHLLLLNLWRQMVAEESDPPRLCIIGKRGWENENIVDMLERCDTIRDAVTEFSDLCDADVQLLMRASSALLFPSFTEGLGIPLLEAAAMGLPCIVSDIPVFREIAPAGTTFLDPLDGPGWKDAILSRCERKQVFEAIDAHFQPDRITGILAPPGSGKTTAASLTTGKLRPDFGRVHRTSLVSFPVGSGSVFNGMLTGRENLAFLCRVFGFDPRPIIRFVVEFGDLAQVIDKPFKLYNRDERTRMLFASSYAIPFDTYVVDDSLIGGRGAFRDQCEELVKERMETSGFIIYSSSPRVIRKYCNVFFVIDGLTMHEVGSADDAVALLGATRLREGDGYAEEATDGGEVYELNPRSSTGKNALLNEVNFFDPGVKSLSTSEVVKSLVTSPMGITAREVPITGKVIAKNPVRALPPYDRIFNHRNLFGIARWHFRVFGRFLETMYEQPAEIAHWTYPLPVRLKQAANIYTIHDLVPLRLPYTTLDNKKEYYRVVRDIAQRADHIVTVSEASKRDIVDLLDVPEERVTNTYQSVSLPEAILSRSYDEVAAEVEAIFGLEPNKYFLFFGAIEPKKNVGRIIEAYLASQSKFPLVVIGQLTWKNANDLRLLGVPGQQTGRSSKDTPLDPSVSAVSRAQQIALLDTARQTAAAEPSAPSSGLLIELCTVIEARPSDAAGLRREVFREAVKGIANVIRNGQLPSELPLARMVPGGYGTAEALAQEIERANATEPVTLAELRQLRQKLKAADGASEDIDESVKRLYYSKVFATNATTEDILPPGSPSQSLDLATIVTERVLPNGWWTMGSNGINLDDHPIAKVGTWTGDDPKPETGPTAPLALLSALVLTLIETAKKEG